MDHLGGHNGSGGRAVSADKAGGAEDRVGGGGRGLVLGQDCGGAQECEVRARHSQALEEGLRLLAEDERVVTKVGSLRLLDPSLQSMQVLGHSHPHSLVCSNAVAISAKNSKKRSLAQCHGCCLHKYSNTLSALLCTIPMQASLPTLSDTAGDICVATKTQVHASDNV